MSRTLLISLALLLPLIGCEVEEPDFIPEGFDSADELGDGSYGLSFQSIDSVIGLPSVHCNGDELCGLSLDFGLGDFEQPNREESDLSQYGIELEGIFTDFNGDQIVVTENYSMPDILSGGFGVSQMAPSNNGGGWDIKFRPTFSGNVLEVFDGGFQLSGFKFKATLPLCGGLPCR